MSDVYNIQASMTLAGNLAPELAKMLKTATSVEQRAMDAEKAFAGWASPIEKAVKEAQALAKAMSGLKSSGGMLDKEMVGWAAALAKPIAEMRVMHKATESVARATTGISNSVSGWTRQIASATNALRSMQAAAAAVHMPHMPAGGGGGGGGGGGTAAGAPHGGRHNRGGGHGGGSHGPFGAHQAQGIVGTYSATGAPTASFHYIEEALKLAGGVDQVAEIQRVQGGLTKDASGANRAMTPTEIADEIRKNKEAAFAVATKQAYTTPLDNMKSITDLADLGKGDYDEARHLLPAFAKMNYVASLIGGEEVTAKLHEHGQSRYLARGLDQMGVMAKSPEDQDKYFRAFMQGTIGTRGIFDGKQLFGAVSHSGGTATHWSPEFVGSVLPMLIEQMGGGATGDSLYMAEKHLYKGQVSNKREAMEMVKLGLIKESDFINDDKGVFKGMRQGAIPGSEGYFKEGQGNLYGFYKDILKPLLAAKGITGREGIDKAIDGLTFAKNYAKMLHEFSANEGNLDANILRFKSQSDPQALIDKTMGGQAQQLLSSGKTLATTIADPMAPGATDVLRELKDAITGLNKFFRESPAAAQGAFAGGAAAAGGIGAAGLVGLGMAGLGALPPLAIAVGVGATVTIAALTLPWGPIAEALGLGGVTWKKADLVNDQAYFEAANDPTKKAAAAAGMPVDGVGFGFSQVKQEQQALKEASTGVATSAQEAATGINQVKEAAAGVGGVTTEAAGGVSALKGSADGAGGIFSAAAAGLSTLIAAARSAVGMSGAASGAPAAGGASPSVGAPTAPAAGAPAAPGKQSSYAPRGGAVPPIHVATAVQLDGRTVGRAVTRHQVAELDTRNGTGRFDDNGLQTPVGYARPLTA